MGISCQNDMKSFCSRDDVLALPIHLGYLGYDSDTEEMFILNRELMHASWAEGAGKVADIPQ